MYRRGVTLLEILIVLLLVGVIAALSLPAYRRHLVRVHRGEAIVTLHEIAAAEERHYLRHGRYTSDITAAPPDGLGFISRTQGRYQFHVAAAEDGQSYIATASPTPAGGQDTDGECLEFSLDHRGRRAVSGSRDTAFCWR